MSIHKLFSCNLSGKLSKKNYSHPCISCDQCSISPASHWPSCFFADEGFYLTGFVFPSAQGRPLKGNLRLSIYVHFQSCALLPCPFKNHLLCVVCIQVIPVHPKTIYLVWCVYGSSLSVQKPSTLCGVYTGHPCPSKKHLPCVYKGHLCPFENHLPCVVCIRVVPVHSKSFILCDVYTGHPCPFKNHLPCVVCSSVHGLSLSIQKTSTLCGVYTGRPCPSVSRWGFKSSLMVPSVDLLMPVLVRILLKALLSS